MTTELRANIALELAAECLLNAVGSFPFRDDPKFRDRVRALVIQDWLDQDIEYLEPGGSVPLSVDNVFDQPVFGRLLKLIFEFAWEAGRA